MSETTNTRRKILDFGEALLQDVGYNGFSYAHIASELGVKNAAVHYHFPSKEELGCAIVKRYRDRFQLWINNSRVKDLSSVEKLDWFFGIYTNYRADNGKVCLAGTLETEFNAIPESLRAETEALTGEILTWLEQTLIEGRMQSLFSFKGEASDKAALILASLQGALQVARSMGTEKFYAVVRQHKADLMVS
jgi:TetR/AcrR family transcriptional regulator, transcriptional repressor for nem operon